MLARDIIVDASRNEIALWSQYIRYLEESRFVSRSIEYQRMRYHSIITTYFFAYMNGTLAPELYQYGLHELLIKAIEGNLFHEEL